MPWRFTLAGKSSVAILNWTGRMAMPPKLVLGFSNARTPYWSRQEVTTRNSFQNKRYACRCRSIGTFIHMEPIKVFTFDGANPDAKRWLSAIWKFKKGFRLWSLIYGSRYQTKRFIFPYWEGIRKTNLFLKYQTEKSNEAKYGHGFGAHSWLTKSELGTLGRRKWPFYTEQELMLFGRI